MNKHNTELKILQKELDWFYSVLCARINHYFRREDSHNDSSGDAEKDRREKRGGEEPMSLDAPSLGKKDSHYASMVKRLNLGREERLILMLAITPDIKPEYLDIFFTQNKDFNRGFTQFGGIKGKTHGGFIPTVETGYFLLTGGDIHLRLRYVHLFKTSGRLRQNNILDINAVNEDEPFGGTPLRLNKDILDMLILGELEEPESGERFPAKKLQTHMEWDDLVLCETAKKHLKEVLLWLEHGDRLLKDENLKKRIKPGFRSLFYGPPGTGKTLSATLLGKLANRDVYRVDLSQVVSKYIGETEKNLEIIFRRAENRDWILFFDEADSLFGKRTEIKSSHDRYANQGTGYLLQRIEDCPNVVILASNLKSNIDDAFMRRFQSAIFFPMPGGEERLKLWTEGFSSASFFGRNVNMEKLAEEHELSGASIMNVIRYSSLMAVNRGGFEISLADVEAGLLKEYEKEGKLMLGWRQEGSV